MRRVSLRNLGAHKVRLILTVVSVVLGTAFIAGSFVFTDSLQHTFDKIFADSYKGVDVHVQSRSARGIGVPVSLVDTLKQVPGVRQVEVEAGGPLVVVNRSNKPLRTGGAPSVGGIWLPPGHSLGKVPTFESGGPPTGPGEAVINSGAAKRAGLTTGSQAKVLVPSAGLVNVTITGVYHTDTETGGYVGLLFPQDQALKLFTDGTTSTRSTWALSPACPRPNCATESGPSSTPTSRPRPGPRSAKRPRPPCRRRSRS